MEVACWGRVNGIGPSKPHSLSLRDIQNLGMCSSLDGPVKASP